MFDMISLFLLVSFALGIALGLLASPGIRSHLHLLPTAPRSIFQSRRLGLA